MYSVGNENHGGRAVTQARYQWAVGEPYRLPALTATADNPNLEVGYKLSPNPPGFFVNRDSAEAIGVPDNTSTFFNQARTVTVYATTAGFADTALGTITFEYRYSDSDEDNPQFNTNGPEGSPCANSGVPFEPNTTAVHHEFDNSYFCNCSLTVDFDQPYGGPNCELQRADVTVASYGPNGTACFNGGARVDEYALDRAFTCDCSMSNGFDGDNCESAPAAAAAAQASADSGTTVAGVLGGVVVLMFVVLIIFRVQVYRLKHRPLDVNVMQQTMLQRLAWWPAPTSGQTSLASP